MNDGQAPHEEPLDGIGESPQLSERGQRTPPRPLVSRRPPVRRGRGAGRPGAAARSTARGASAQRSPRAGRKARGCIAAVVFAVLVLAAGGAAVWYTLFRAEVDVPAGQTLRITVPKGASATDVGRLLAAKGVVSNATMFELQARMAGAGGRLKAGSYDLETGAGYDAAITVIATGPPPAHYTKLAIPEGWTVGQVAARVESKTGISGEEFARIATTEAKRFQYEFLTSNPTDSLEGYLFPKTYEVKEGSTAEDVIRMMLAQYGKETAGLDLTYASSRGVSEHGVVTIASIIEREASVPTDRPLVASVIYNRLAIHMRLQLDSTVLYVVGNKDRLLLSDLQAPSAYNTYLHEGLPPGPIASPGLTALTAGSQPTSSKYLYYIMDHKDGSQSFATSYAEFLKLKAAAKKGLK